MKWCWLTGHEWIHSEFMKVENNLKGEKIVPTIKQCKKCRQKYRATNIYMYKGDGEIFFNWYRVE